MECWLVLFIKEPKAGRVKTRLGAGMGVVRATMVYRHMTACLMRRVADSVGWKVVAAITPDETEDSNPVLRGADFSIGQGKGGLGARMARIFAEMPPGPVVIIGTDIPDITASDIEAAFRALKHADMVVGPAGDGGFWLIGLAARARRFDLFGSVRWSSAHALADTLANLPEKRRVCRLRTLRDIDRREDFIAWTDNGGRLSR